MFAHTCKNLCSFFYFSSLFILHLLLTMADILVRNGGANKEFKIRNIFIFRIRALASSGANLLFFSPRGSFTWEYFLVWMKLRLLSKKKIICTLTWWKIYRKSFARAFFLETGAESVSQCDYQPTLLIQSRDWNA